MEKITLDYGKIRKEARRLNEMGALVVRWVNQAKPSYRAQNVACRCVGFAVDGEERDCLLLRSRDATGHFVIRCVVATQITEVWRVGVSETVRESKTV